MIEHMQVLARVAGKARDVAWAGDRTLLLASPGGLVSYEIGSDEGLHQVQVLPGVDVYKLAAWGHDTIAICWYEAGRPVVGRVVHDRLHDVRSVPAGPIVNSLDVDGCGRLLAATDDRTWVWSANGDELTLVGGGPAVFCGDGRAVVDSPGGEGLDVVDVVTQERRQLGDLDLLSMDALVVDRHTDSVVCGFTTGEVVVVSTRGAGARRTLHHGGWITDLSVAASTMAVVDRDGGMSVWQRPFWDRLPTRHTLVAPAWAVALSPTATYAAVLNDAGLTILDVTR